MTQERATGASLHTIKVGHRALKKSSASLCWQHLDAHRAYFEQLISIDQGHKVRDGIAYRAMIIATGGLPMIVL